MPQLAKGGKWIFGWCSVGPARQIRIPPEAYTEYGFKPGENAIILRGSKRSGGISLGRAAVLAGSILQSRCLGQTTMGAEGCFVLPIEIGILPGECLLVVRGSGLALGFLQCGPIYEEALKHPEIKRFTVG